MKNFLMPDDKFPPVHCRVFEDYDRLDALAEKRGYKCPEIFEDERVATTIGTGAQNTALHCGWIATMGDSGISVDAQVGLLKEKIKRCLERKETIIIGFCQTGTFSIGYSIYRKL